jgi:hypothetical protein
MADPKLSILLKRLSKRTREGKIAWAKTIEDDKFQTAFPEGIAIQLSKRPSRDPDSPADAIDYVLTILNEEGDIVEELSDLDFDHSDLGENPYVLMREMHNTARRIAMGAEKAIDALLSTLEDPEDEKNVPQDDIPF